MEIQGSKLRKGDKYSTEKDPVIGNLKDSLREKNLKLEHIQNELSATKENLELIKIENSRLKENLSDTANELILNKQKIKSFVTSSEQPTVNFEKTNESRAFSQNLDELNILRSEVSFLRDKINKMERTQQPEEDEASIKRDIASLSEYKISLENEKAKTNKI